VSEYGDWLATMPMDDTYPSWLAEGRRRGWVNGHNAPRVAQVETDAAFETRMASYARRGITSAEIEAFRRDHYGERYRPPTAPTIGTRTACDLRFGLPPEQLVRMFLTPEGPTVLYARGGTGKGLIACWLVLHLVRAGHVAMVLDYEGHEREWGSRLRGLELTEDELARVHYRAPFGSDWTAETGPLSKVAALVREDAVRLGVTYIVVDSYTVATSNGDTMGGEAAAREYFSALSIIGLPSLTIAHVRGDSPRFPDRPFGSVFVHNLARETWAVERLADDEPVVDPDLLEHGPAVVRLELRNRKANGRAAAPAQFVTFEFYANGSIVVTEDPPKGRRVWELADAVLVDGSMTAKQIAAAIAEDTGEKVGTDDIRRALERQPSRFTVNKSKRPHTWSRR